MGISLSEEARVTLASTAVFVTEDAETDFLPLEVLGSDSSMNSSISSTSAKLWTRVEDRGVL